MSGPTRGLKQQIALFRAPSGAGFVTPHRTSIVSPGCLTDGLLHRADEDPVSPKVREGFPDFISRYSEPDSIGTGFIELQCVDAKDRSGCKVNEWATTVPMVHRCICLQEGHAII